MVFPSSIARPTDTPIYASTSTSRCSLQDSGPRWIRFSFLVGLFHSQQHAGLSRRTYDNPVVHNAVFCSVEKRAAREQSGGRFPAVDSVAGVFTGVIPR